MRPWATWPRKQRPPYEWKPKHASPRDARSEAIGCPGASLMMRILREPATRKPIPPADLGTEADLPTRRAEKIPVPFERHARPDWLAGHVELEPANPWASYD